MTMRLPKFELFEEGGQIRRSSKSVVHHIVEGFGRRKYRNDFLKYITVAIAECDESQVALELLYRTASLKDQRATNILKKNTTNWQENLIISTVPLKGSTKARSKCKNKIIRYPVSGIRHPASNIIIHVNTNLRARNY